MPKTPVQATNRLQCYTVGWREYKLSAVSLRDMRVGPWITHKRQCERKQTKKANSTNQLHVSQSFFIAYVHLKHFKSEH